MTKAIDNTTTQLVLGGMFAEKYGREHDLVVSSPIEAIRLMILNYPEFQQDILDCHEQGIEFHLSSGDYDITLEQLNFPVPQSRKIVFTPVPAGAKSGGLFGALETIVGVALIATAFINPAALALGPTAIAGLYAAGASLVLGGITTLLTTVPKVNGNGSTTLQSYYFNGTAAGTVQGAPVPVVYGRMLIPGNPISASMDAVDLSQAPTEENNKGDL